MDEACPSVEVKLMAPTICCSHAGWSRLRACPGRPIFQGHTAGFSGEDGTMIPSLVPAVCSISPEPVLAYVVVGMDTRQHVGIFNLISRSDKSAKAKAPGSE